MLQYIRKAEKVGKEITGREEKTMDLNRLQEPITIGKLTVPNRLVMPPMASGKTTKEGRVTDDICDYYGKRADGGCIGLIIVEHAFVSLEGKAHQGQMSIAEDGDISGLQKLTSIIHKDGTKAFIQINHAGSAASSSVTGCETVSASTVQSSSGNVSREMKQEDIEKVISDFTAAAVRAKKAGFDGVEIHSAHGYLLNQFYSPLTNYRTDIYSGQYLEGRLRLHLQIIDAIRCEVGSEFPIAIRLGACDYMDGGTSLQDSVLAAQLLEKAGIDLLDISGGLCGFSRPGVKIPGYFSELSEEIKKYVSVPVLVTGGITDIFDAERLLEENRADMIGVGRAIRKEWEWAKKIRLCRR